MSKNSERRVVLIGSVAAGSTSVIQAILKSSEPAENTFETQIFIKKCQSHRVKVGEHDMVFCDTPGLCNPEMTDEEVTKEIKTCITKSGHHVFLFLLSMDRFTDPKKKMVETVKTTFGENVTDHMILLFTEGNISDEDRNIRQFVAGSEELRAFDDQCKGGHMVFDTEKEDPSQVTQLLQQISRLHDGGRCYTHNMLKKAESRAGLRTRVKLSIGGGALAGAGVGGFTPIVQGLLGIGIGAVMGAAAGGVVGAVGVVIAQHVKEKIMLR